MIEPYGENELGDRTLQYLWKKACAGDEHCPRYTEYAIANDKNFQTLALSKSTKNIGLAMKHIPDEGEAGQLFDSKIYAKVKAEATELRPHVLVLSGGQMRKEGGGKLNAYKASPVEKGKAETAAKFVYAWLTNGNSNLRGMLKFLSKGGCFYTAFANEKLTRAYIAGENVQEKEFTELCVHRLCPPEVARSDDGAIDWSTVK